MNINTVSATVATIVMTSCAAGAMAATEFLGRDAKRAFVDAVSGERYYLNERSRYTIRQSGDGIIGAYRDEPGRGELNRWRARDVDPVAGIPFGVLGSQRRSSSIIYCDRLDARYTIPDRCLSMMRQEFLGIVNDSESPTMDPDRGHTPDTDAGSGECVR